MPWEANLVYKLNTIESAGLHTTTVVASDALLPLMIGTPVLLYAYGGLPLAVFDDTEYGYRYAAESGLQLAVTSAATYGITLILKEIVGRPRPYQAYPECITGYETDSDGSWPSGHSAGSAALATTLSLRYPKWYVIAPSALYALYTGFSRMHLGMHYLTDVLSGYALGVGIALIVNKFNDELFNAAEGILPHNPASTGGFAPLSTMRTFGTTGSLPLISFSYRF
ncbi:MAG: phosphatase PAP2 family protein [Ignavibacteria bacterium]|nr:phosphatase PAP2 family protein [Ignavibacteria bacterium]